MLASAVATLLLLADDADWDHMDGGWWIVMGVGMILFWGLVILGIVWLVRELGGQSRGTHAAAGPDPSEILDRRLAEGEITVAEYEERRRALRESR